VVIPSNEKTKDIIQDRGEEFGDNFGLQNGAPVAKFER
jgi:hypothetical protein